MPVSKAKVTSYLSLCPLVLLLLLLRSYILMYGVVPLFLLVDMSIMLALLMHTVDLHGSTCSNENLMCFTFFFSSKNMLNAFLIRKSYMFNQTGVASILS